MLKTLDRFYIGAKIRMANFADQFKKDETGVSSIVATIEETPVSSFLN